MSKTKVIGVSGYARSGKDTFVSIAKKILIRNGYVPIHIAFADRLKTEVTEMLKENGFEASVYTDDSDAKKLIRPLLVWWGCQRRYESDGGLYWVNVADDQIRKSLSGYPYPDKLVFLISDARFANEATWIQNEWDGVVIHLKRYEIMEVCEGHGRYEFEKVYDKSPNEEEAKNDPVVQAKANHLVEWESAKKMTSAEAVADPQLQAVVMDTLNRTKYFKHPTNGTLS